MLFELDARNQFAHTLIDVKNRPGDAVCLCNAGQIPTETEFGDPSMDPYQTLMQRIEENEATAEKFFHVESRILSILDFRDFFDVLLNEIRTTFAIPFAWLCIIETSEIMALIRRHASEARLTESLHCIGPDDYDRLFGDQPAPLLCNDMIDRYAPVIPADIVRRMGSMALIPMALYGAPVGLLSLGDSAADRFSPDHDASLLKQLGVKVSLCLSNVTAHEKLRFLASHDPLTGLINRRVLGQDPQTGIRALLPIRPCAIGDFHRHGRIQTGQRHVRPSVRRSASAPHGRYSGAHDPGTGCGGTLRGG